MKTLRKSRSAEYRNARKAIDEHGRAGTMRSALQPSGAFLRGRQFRRANHLDHAEAARLEALVYGTAPLPDSPSLNLLFDERTMTILGYKIN